MEGPSTVETIGLNANDGLGYIIAMEVSVDSGHHLTSVLPVSYMFRTFHGEVYSKFSYYNKTTSNMIYREIDHD